MSNVLGKRLTITLFGESHGEYIGAVLDGLPAGFAIDEQEIAKQLSRRRPSGKGETKRVEKDEFKIISGVYQGHSTGAPITILIPNSDTKSKDYEKLANTPRPSHADYAALLKYNGFNDPRGGGRFSGRLTAPLVAVGGIIIPILESQGIYLFSHIKELGGYHDTPFLGLDLEKLDYSSLQNSPFPTIDEEVGSSMKKAIEEVAASGDSIGGTVETAIIGVPAGLGDPNFDSFESLLSHAIFSIPAIKGLEFGKGFGFKDGLGSTLNDQFAIGERRVYTTTNNNGGINGGISNGMPIFFSSSVKPTPSISKPQKSVDLEKLSPVELSIPGRHDPAIVRRIIPVIEAMAAFVTMDLFIDSFGRD
ncbi:MAG: chorismate synthase [Bacillota bacterium]|nr:chorismate synthase [Bacillota bacterium]